MITASGVPVVISGAAERGGRRAWPGWNGLNERACGPAYSPREHRQLQTFDRPRLPPHTMTPSQGGRMNFQQLRSVREAIRHGLNLTAVAEALHTSQPGVSRQIRELEEELGIQIFHRSGKRLTGLTPPGK